MLVKLPWDLAPELPWHVFTNPAHKWAEQSSFVVGEYLFYACAVVALLHALSQGEARRQHLLVWVGAFIAGTANDMIFMALPLVNNFWQAQATVMLTPRLPLYIPCVYISFMYIPTVSVWRLGLPPLARATLSGLCGSLFYAPYDIIGAKFLWWTWHDSDPAIGNRIMGAPIGSTMWTITFTAAFSFLVSRALDKRKTKIVTAGTFCKGLAMVAAFSTLTFVLQITALQQLDSGLPGIRGLMALIALYGTIVATGWQRAVPAPWSRKDVLLNGTIVAYFITLFVIGATTSPQSQRSASIHQTYGACHVTATDITGHTRYKYLCAEDFDEDFTFACTDHLPAAGSDWYTVCGRPHQDFRRFLLATALLCGLGILLYSYLLGAFRRRLVKRT